MKGKAKTFLGQPGPVCPSSGLSHTRYLKAIPQQLLQNVLPASWLPAWFADWDTPAAEGKIGEQ